MLKSRFGLFVLLCFFAITSGLKAQPRFEIPGQFVFDVYVNQFNEASPRLPIKTWGSRGFNIYYLQEVNIANDKLSLNPGFGISSEKYSFLNDITLVRQPVNNVLLIESLPSNWDVRKTFLSAEYFDFPIELRFQTAEGYRAFRFAVGFRVGRLINSRTKIKYESLEGDIIKLKEHNNFLLSKWRYGLTTRIGLGKFNVFGAYNLNTVFEKDVLSQEIQEYNPTSFVLGFTFFTF